MDCGVASVLWYLGVARNYQNKLKPLRSQNFICPCSNSKNNTFIVNELDLFIICQLLFQYTLFSKIYSN